MGRIKDFIQYCFDIGRTPDLNNKDLIKMYIEDREKREQLKKKLS